MTAAAMSSSSLRTKFRQAYGHSVFDYLRDCRLEGWHERIAGRWSYRQLAAEVAHLCLSLHAGLVRGGLAGRGG